MAKAKSKKKKVDLLAGVAAPSGPLLRAVRDFVDFHGGSVLVIGSIELQKWPEDREFTYRISVKCTGKPPTIPPQDRSGEP